VSDIHKISDFTLRDIIVSDKPDQSSQRKPKIRKKHYDPGIINAWCKSCGICSEFCPQKVIGLNDMGAPVIERPDDCTGCRFCELHCPDFAITVKERQGTGRTK